MVKYTVWFVGHGFWIIPYGMRQGQHPRDLPYEAHINWQYVDVEAKHTDSRIASDVAWYTDTFDEVEVST